MSLTRFFCSIGCCFKIASSALDEGFITTTKMIMATMATTAIITTSISLEFFIVIIYRLSPCDFNQYKYTKEEYQQLHQWNLIAKYLFGQLITWCIVIDHCFLDCQVFMRKTWGALCLCSFKCFFMNFTHRVKSNYFENYLLISWSNQSPQSHDLFTLGISHYAKPHQ